MYCSNCRRIIENEEAAFCPECGNPLVPAPFAEELPPPAFAQAPGAAAGSRPQPIPGPGADQAAPGPAPAPQMGADYSSVTPGSDTAAFTAINSGISAANSTVQMPAAPPSLSPPPLRTGGKRPKRNGKPTGANQSKGVPVALIIIVAVMLMFVAGLAFLWVYFDLELKDLINLIPKRQTASDSVVPDGGDELNDHGGSLTAGGNDSDLSTASPAQAPAPTEVPRAEATESTVVFRDARPNARLLANGVAINFEYVGNDIVVQKADLPEICQVELVAENNGVYEMAAIWYNSQSENDLPLTGTDSEYVPCDANGLGKPSESFIATLLAVYHRSFLRAINEQSTSYLQFSTEKNTYAENDHVFNTVNSRNTYDLNNFGAEFDTSSVTYSNDGKITLNALFTSTATNRETGKEAPVVSRKTMELVWENGVWKVNRLAFVNENDYASGRYADLP